MIANYHTHTRWCRHGSGEIEDYIREALSKGLEELAITEHVPLPGDPDSRRMYCHEFDAFDAELNSLIEKYADRIRVRKGFECEYYPDLLAYYSRLRKQHGYEILILGHHTSADRSIDNFAIRSPGEVSRYAMEVCEGLKTGVFTFLAHPDVPLCGYSYFDDAVTDAMSLIFETAATRNIPVEINANGLHYDRGYPSPRVWELARHYNPLCIVGSDAHHAADLACESVDLCADMAIQFGLNLQTLLP
ncbi:histidinol-phosphatase [Spirochaetia bacterium]|nr:histidinol-phosphatase [Spirochaetia bacterium]